MGGLLSFFDLWSRKANDHFRNSCLRMPGSLAVQYQDCALGGGGYGKEVKGVGGEGDGGQ